MEVCGRLRLLSCRAGAPFRDSGRLGEVLPVKGVLFLLESILVWVTVFPSLAHPVVISDETWETSVTGEEVDLEVKVSSQFVRLHAL